MLSFNPMQAPSTGQLPLTLPQELWSALPPAEQERYQRAQDILGVFQGSRTLRLRDIVSGVHAQLGDVLGALQVLDGMDLVSVEAADAGPLVTLRALPDEHVKIVGPDGRTRWLFVARPIDAPELDPEDLN